MRGIKGRVREALRAQERSQAWLARQLRMNETLLGHYLAERRTVPSDLVERIAAVLGVDPDSLRPSEDVVAA